MKLQDFSNELRKDPYFVIAEYQLKLEEANARIAELEAQTRWIPVWEMLPEGNQIVICYVFVSDNIAVARYCEREGSFYEYWRGGELTVTHWQPLPGKPEVKNE